MNSQLEKELVAEIRRRVATNHGLGDDVAALTLERLKEYGSWELACDKYLEGLFEWLLYRVFEFSKLNDEDLTSVYYIYVGYHVVSNVKPRKSAPFSPRRFSRHLVFDTAARMHAEMVRRGLCTEIGEVC